MSRKLLITLLLFSVGLNLVLVGFGIGRATLAGRHPGPDNPALISMGLIRSLPEERRDRLRPAVRAYFKAVRPEIREMRHTQRALLDAIAAEPFQPERLARALDDLGTGLAGVRAAGQEPFLALIAQLTPAERRQLVERLARGPQHRHPPGAPRDQQGPARNPPP